MQSPCYYYYYQDASSIAGGLYKLSYLGDKKFSELKQTKEITINEYVEKNNFCQLNEKPKETRTEFYNTDLVPNGYQIHLDLNNNLYVRFKESGLITKYGESYKIASDVSNFYNIMIGQGGGNILYYIYNDKTVGAASIEYNIHKNEEIEITDKLDYKNIVNIKQGVSDDISPISYPIFVSEDGKEYHQ